MCKGALQFAELLWRVLLTLEVATIWVRRLFPDTCHL
jgi:hypothetical protein